MDFGGARSILYTATDRKGLHTFSWWNQQFAEVIAQHLEHNTRAARDICPAAIPRSVIYGDGHLLEFLQCVCMVSTLGDACMWGSDICIVEAVGIRDGEC